MREKVEQALAKIRPMLERDGGSVDLIEVDGSVVKVTADRGLQRLPHEPDDSQIGYRADHQAGSPRSHRSCSRLAPNRRPGLGHARGFAPAICVHSFICCKAHL